VAAAARGAGIALQLGFERGKLARGLGQLLSVEVVDLRQLPVAESEEGLVKPVNILIHTTGIIFKTK
jgi:hypothetical protein